MEGKGFYSDQDAEVDVPVGWQVCAVRISDPSTCSALSGCCTGLCRECMLHTDPSSLARYRYYRCRGVVKETLVLN